jgi:hypothetical protein
MGAHDVAMPRSDVWLHAGPAPVIEHGRFGPMRASFRRDSDGFTWECLDLVPTTQGPADLEFEASAWGPDASHERQLETILENLDALTRTARPLVAAEIGRSCDLEWQGAQLTGRAGTFRLHYWCRSVNELLVTVLFDQSQPATAELHD